MLHPVATWVDSSTASTKIWFKMVTNSEDNDLIQAAHCPLKSFKCPCNALASSSVSTRLAVYIQTLDVSGSVNLAMAC